MNFTCYLQWYVKNKKINAIFKNIRKQKLWKISNPNFTCNFIHGKQKEVKIVYKKEKRYICLNWHILYEKELNLPFKSSLNFLYFWFNFFSPSNQNKIIRRFFCSCSDFTRLVKYSLIMKRKLISLEVFYDKCTERKMSQ